MHATAASKRRDGDCLFQMVEAEGLDRAQQSQNPLSATLIAGERRLASLVQQRPKHNSLFA